MEQDTKRQGAARRGPAYWVGAVLILTFLTGMGAFPDNCAPGGGLPKDNGIERDGGGGGGDGGGGY